MIKAVIFDMDGTLVDTLTDLTHLVNLTLRRFGRREISRDAVRRFTGDGAKSLIERSLRESGDTSRFDEIFTSYSEAYNACPIYKLAPYDGIPEALAALRARGVRLAVLTNKPQGPALAIVEKFFPGIFDIVQGDDGRHALKPDPAAALDILPRLGASRAEAAFVGDSSIDVRTGVAAGLYTVGVTWGFRDRADLEQNGASVILDDPRDLPAALTEV